MDLVSVGSLKSPGSVCEVVLCLEVLEHIPRHQEWYCRAGKGPSVFARCGEMGSHKLLTI